MQTVAAFFLSLFESVGLTRAADAAALAGHHLDEVIERLALVDVLQKLLGIGKPVDDRDLELSIADGDRRLLDRRIAAQAKNADLTQGIFALIGQAVAHDRFGNAAARTVNDCGAGAEAKGHIGGLQLQLGELNAGLLHHIDHLARGEHKVNIRPSVVDELRARCFHLFCRAGHDGNMVGRTAVGCVLRSVLVAEDRTHHLHGRLAGRNVLQILGVLVFEIFHPCRAAGSEHRERAAVFQALEEFLGFGDRRKVRAERRIVHLVHAHELERRDELIEHIFAGREAECLAHRHAHCGRDLNDHALFRIVNGAPRLADLVFYGDGAGGAHRGTLAAADALRLGELAVECGHDLQIAAAIGKVQNAHTLHLFAHAHAVAAENALVRVAQHRG